MSGDPVSLRETWTDLDGRRLLYRTNAESPPPADAPVLIHVHGFAISGRYLMPAAWRLAPDFRTYVPDLPGFGRSERSLVTQCTPRQRLLMILTVEVNEPLRPFAFEN